MKDTQSLSKLVMRATATSSSVGCLRRATGMPLPSGLAGAAAVGGLESVCTRTVKPHDCTVTVTSFGGRLMNGTSPLSSTLPPVLGTGPPVTKQLIGGDTAVAPGMVAVTRHGKLGRFRPLSKM